MLCCCQCVIPKASSIGNKQLALGIYRNLSKKDTAGSLAGVRSSEEHPDGSYRAKIVSATGRNANSGGGLTKDR